MSDNKISILFVDDQPEILQGLKRMTRVMRKQWDVSFALGAEKALEMLASETYDVLVTDMRMPGIDGAMLLREVLNLYPSMVRIVLSGQYDVNNFIRSGWSAHQFLSKPSDTDMLIRIITQTIAMRDLLGNSQVKELVTRANALPTLPALYIEIEQELRLPNASMKRVAEIISQDIGLTTKVLQLVNSPIFGFSRNIETPEQAVVMLGVDVIKSLALYLQACATIPIPKGISLERISKHAIAVGTLARDIAKLEGKGSKVCGDAFLAGILQNIGSLIILSGYPNEYEQITREANESNLPVWKVEKNILGASHAEIGAYLIALWGLPTSIAESVAYHNSPSECPDQNISFALTAVHAANALEKEPGLGAAFVENYFDFEYLEKLGLIDRLPAWQKLYQEKRGEV